MRSRSHMLAILAAACAGTIATLPPQALPPARQPHEPVERVRLQPKTGRRRAPQPTADAAEQIAAAEAKRARRALRRK